MYLPFSLHFIFSVSVFLFFCFLSFFVCFFFAFFLLSIFQCPLVLSLLYCLIGLEQAQIDMDKVLEQDPSTFQYDELYDDINEKRRAKDPRLAPKDKTKVQPKYIKNLLVNADKRKLDDELRLERLAQRDREREGDEFADKDKFVTQAYKDKMVKLRQLQEEQDRQEVLERMSMAFYGNT